MHSLHELLLIKSTVAVNLALLFWKVMVPRLPLAMSETLLYPARCASVTDVVYREQKLSQTQFIPCTLSYQNTAVYKPTNIFRKCPLL
jgi:hypothetical protein